ncbi:ZYRO0G11704p [Zygosaccharomyces rouxii]|uniref:ZYRO0G11704p n=1 Tax=Zygosaccharomyces rouxii (strain ATCC 2623 / CBS 732 / NBRC 1130 / NCYC 568 / NRRL Y-229) TaxID=559307 RepID=C5E0D0_ZYGRC|nr:uncharacterized protein ZYRO0G11704g [Zygosaccharomyces rouxii]KAH9202557.1 hypothetical protein LQ764DRAFT_222693 [Zygosaccharomyces rouxii]CAR29564.1 ZYRO0G11704p [Zygosaccharomyces rouxii]
MRFFLQCLFYYCVTAAVTLVNAKDDSFFTNVGLRDSVSGYAYCRDPNHWFQIDAELFLSEGQDRDVFLSIPREFTGLPTEPFELMHKSQVIGKVMISDDHLVQISFPIPPKENITGNLRFMAKLDPDAVESIEAPRIINYNFYSSQGEHFKEPIRFEPRSLGAVHVDGGMFLHNNTAWFVVDIPVEQLNEPVYVSSDPGAGSPVNQHQIIQGTARCELVTSVDSFHRPRITEPIEPLEDYTSESSVLMKFDHNLDGYYVRILYYTRPRILEFDRPIRAQTAFYKRTVKGLTKYAIYS